MRVEHFIIIIISILLHVQVILTILYLISSDLMDRVHKASAVDRQIL